MANSDNKAFDMMTTVADKTAVDLFPVESEKSTKSIHTALMAAGMTPAYGNIADLADATLYILEGELGNAAWSAAAAVPIIGQMVSGKRALKAAKKAGEEMVTLYRGQDKWYPGNMVKKGKFLGGKPLGKWQFDRINYNIAEGHIKQTPVKHLPYKENLRGIWTTTKKIHARKFAATDSYTRLTRESDAVILEFEVPKSYLKKSAIQTHIDYPQGTMGDIFLFTEGLPKEFLKKVHK